MGWRLISYKFVNCALAMRWQQAREPPDMPHPTPQALDGQVTANDRRATASLESIF